MKTDRTAGFPGLREPHTVRMYRHLLYRSVLGLDWGQVLKVKMMECWEVAGQREDTEVRRPVLMEEETCTQG